MTIYLVNKIYNTDPSYIAFTDKQLAEEHKEQSTYMCAINEIELVTDAFMELTLQPPNSKILSETVTAIVSDWNTIEPRFKLFGGTSGSLKYFTKVKPGTKLQITIKELI